ncbi:hypothetical protein PYCC9005_001008 [Savitreella phatthalungensis]
MKVVAAEPGVVRCRLEIEPHHCNRLSILHGGVITCLTDTTGSLAVASRGLYSTGVSTDLHVTFIRGAGKVGDSVDVVARCDLLGKTLAYTRCDFFATAGAASGDVAASPEADQRNDGMSANGAIDDGLGKLVARGTHTKYVSHARAHPDNDLDGLKEIAQLEAEAAASTSGTRAAAGEDGRRSWTTPS